MTTNVADTGGLSGSRVRVLRSIALGLVWLLVAMLTLWALVALYIDIRIPALCAPLALLYALWIVWILVETRGGFAGAAMCLGSFCAVLIWWLSLKPSNQGLWEADVERTGWAEVDGDRVTLHNFRNCTYRSELEFENCWSDKTVELSQIRGLDLFFITWGPRWLDHTIASFQFGDNEHIAFSVERRVRAGQPYFAILAFFRQYPMAFIAADERDIIRLRTNYRKGEEVYLYRTRMQRQEAREIFLAYVNYLNEVSNHPKWYNAFTRNCKTTMSTSILGNSGARFPWDLRSAGSRTLDELLYNRGRLVTEGLPFEELRRHAHINEAARATDEADDFPALIRAGRTGF